MRAFESDFHGSGGRASLPVTSRVGALAVTAAVHLALIAGFLGRAAPEPDHGSVVWIQASPRRAATKPATSPMAPPSVIVAFAATPPPPVFMIAPDAGPPTPLPVVAAPAPPPMHLPSPPNAYDGGSNAGPSWETALLARLAGAKTYPPGAKAAKQQGVVLLRFSMDRDGNILTAKMEKSSGYAALDAEALAALVRAQPLPRPPPEVAGNMLDLIVPVDFF